MDRLQDEKEDLENVLPAIADMQNKYTQRLDEASDEIYQLQRRIRDLQEENDQEEARKEARKQPKKETMVEGSSRSQIQSTLESAVSQALCMQTGPSGFQLVAIGVVKNVVSTLSTMDVDFKSDDRWDTSECFSTKREKERKRVLSYQIKKEHREAVKKGKACKVLDLKSEWVI